MRRTAEYAGFVAGWVAIVVGLAMMYRPLAWVGGGAALVAAAAFSRKGS